MGLPEQPDEMATATGDSEDLWHSSATRMMDQDFQRQLVWMQDPHIPHLSAHCYVFADRGRSSDLGNRKPPLLSKRKCTRHQLLQGLTECCWLKNKKPYVTCSPKYLGVIMNPFLFGSRRPPMPLLSIELFSCFP